jgi:NAD(P)-dependent dehydrogenase (short-subunit alcohol dehydrogenase family)
MPSSRAPETRTNAARQSRRNVPTHDPLSRGWLEGQIAYVTGGASGLGRAIVDRFVEEGASVVVLDRHGPRLGGLQEAHPGHVVAVEGDVRDLGSHRRAVTAAVEHFGGLDVFVGNAGIWDFGTSLVDLPDDRLDAAFDEIFQTNVKGYLLGVKACAPQLVRSGGSVVLTLSNAAFYPGGGGPLYTASKHAGMGLVRQLAFELAPRVRVNAVAPGGMATDLRGPSALGLQNESFGAAMPPDEVVAKLVPLGPFRSAYEHTGPYVLLASRANASSVTGAVIHADGGLGVRGLQSAAGGGALARRFDPSTPEVKTHE